MANNETNDTSTQNSKFAQLNQSHQNLNESVTITQPQFKQKLLKTIYSKDAVRRKHIGCQIFINDLESHPGYKPQKKIICRICMNEEETSRFISPCLCKGTSEFLHEECLKMWILEQSGVSKIYNDEIYCEICHQKLNYDLDFVDRFDIRQFKRVKTKTKICWFLQIIFIFLFIYGSIQVSLQFGINSLATVAIIVVFGLINIALIIYLVINIYHVHKVQMIENWKFQNYKPAKSPAIVQKKKNQITNQFIRVNQIFFT